MSDIGHNAPPEIGPFAIYRHDKLSTESSVRGRAAHMMRTAPTPNADLARLDRNIILVGTTDPAADLLNLIPKVGERDAAGTLLRRRNSVLAIEIMITTSPEWWPSATPQERRAWVKASLDWLAAEYGRERLAHVQLHLDETTPHLTGFIAPTDPQTGRLNARRWIGGKDRCSAQQTAYAAAVGHLGLRRGVEGSKAKHQSVRRFYAAMNAPEPSPERGRAYDIERTARKAAQAQAAADRGRADRAAAALEAQKALAARMRALPLSDVLDALGFENDPQNRAQWVHGPKGARTHRVNVDGTRWFDLAAERGRGGAIDLVQHVLGTDFKGSLAWLADRFGDGATAADLTATLAQQARGAVAEAIAERPPFVPPEPAPENWPAVRSYLTDKRALPARAVDELHARGDVYADQRRNAVFVCRDTSGEVTGAELKSPRFAGMAPGSRKTLGGFRLGRVLEAARVYLVESAIDAVSLWLLRRRQGETGFAVVSTAGTRSTVPAFLSERDPATIINAFDADAPGDRAARRMGLAERMRPGAAKDWNDELRQGARGGGATTPQAARSTEGRKRPAAGDDGAEGPGF
ncbi:MAG: hypothetical protein DI629_20880 [Mesorhizobium amorphae]|nr:MAG: hypothetical protein DI629_20880 [Mesorhizobium amorphae]